MSILTRLRGWKPGNQKRAKLISRTVLCDDRGVSQCDWLGDREVETCLRWDEVATVTAYKKDCYAFDQIHMVLADADEHVVVNVSEDDAGYEMLINQLPKRIEGCPAPDDWWERVALPAFKTNATELFRKPVRNAH